jgi:ABC-type Fe3+/spermidine/putrescine transport system ATPase subunit
MGEPILKLENLYKHFGDIKAVNGISIDIDEGELISFIGPSGCGKTTLLRIIGGFHEQDSGSIYIDGSKVDHLTPNKRPTGMVFQNYALFPHMSVYDNVSYGLKLQKVPKSERKARVAEALSQVQLAGYEKRKPSELSGGQQQRVAIARCLVLKPKVLLLDEPLSNLDANLRMDMREEIRRLKEDLNLTIIFVTHDQEEALSISDRIAVLNKGVIQQLDKPHVVYNKPANEFVANFVGQVNILTGNIKTEGAKTHFKNGNLEFLLDNKLQKKKYFETDTKVIIRPERISIDEKSSLKGEITKLVYNGSFIRYYVEIGDKEISVDEFDICNMGKYQKGDTIGIRITSTPHLLEG